MPAPARPPNLDRAAELDSKFSAGISNALSLMEGALPRWESDLEDYKDASEVFLENMKLWKDWLRPEVWKGFSSGQRSYLARCGRNFSAKTISMDNEASDLAKAAAAWRTSYYAFLKAMRAENSALKKAIQELG